MKSDWGLCDRCHEREAIYPVHRADWSVAYTLCRDCRRELRGWSSSPRAALRPADERPAIDPAIVARVMP